MNLTSLKGLADKTILIFNQLGIFSVEDLLEYYPSRYEVLEPSKTLQSDSSLLQVINVTIESVAKIAYIRRNFNTMRFEVLFQNKQIHVSMFNRAFLKNSIVIGKEITLVGKYDEKKNLFTASDIKLEVVTTNKITPIYRLGKGIKQANFEKNMKEAIVLPVHVVDKIPSVFTENYHFISKTEALKCVHFPQCANDIKKAKLRMVYEELFLFMFQILYLKEKETLAYGLKRDFSRNEIDDFIHALPFVLTEDQVNAIESGLKDLKDEKRMNRLLLGDVGSGKTIVATVLMYANCLSGYQSVLMAPTEILATQHYLSFVKLFENHSIHIELLVGSMKGSSKKNVMEKIATGQVDIIIGTHALLNDQVEFSNLGFVVTDEQHRFGVNQRKMLQNKGYRSDVMYLSATPIPRTYALTIFGDMDTSMIQVKPNGRLPIITELKKETELKDVLISIYDEVKKGHQIYVVAPLIEENDSEELKDVNLLEEKFSLAFRDKVKIGVLHGKLKASEKEAIMNDFKNNVVQLLISTTVIEVGVDVKNATMMVIFNAERFGLATLHQLRGRVGRNELQSYCYLISNQESERLQVLVESNDGFYISEKDFELRGQGDLFGVNQSGDMSFKMADLKRDYKILLQAKKDATEFLKTKEYLSHTFYLDLIHQIDFTN